MSVLRTLTRITQAISEADNPAEQVRLVVDGIYEAMSVDVCSLYLATDEQDLLLVASHGLADVAVGGAVVPKGKGLVGLAASGRHPVNIVDPAQHPAFHYLSGSHEEQFRSFCAVPLIRSGEIIGVLAVQRRLAELLGEEEESFLVTLAAQMALVVANWSDWRATGSVAPRSYKGVRGSRGLALGSVLLCEAPDLFSVAEGRCADPEREVHDWRQLLQRVRDEIRQERAELDASLSEEIAAVFDAYGMLLSDPALSRSVEEGIQGGLDMPSAMKSAFHHYAELFLAMDDPYLRARHEDIRHLGNRLYATWSGSRNNSLQELPDGPLVLVGGEVSVSDIAAVPSERLAAIACFRGSALSHTAVLANALGIPSVMGLGEVKGLRDGESVLVDGDLGRVFPDPDPALLATYRENAANEEALQGRLQELRDEPALTRDGERVLLYANSGLLSDISPGLVSGAEGLGLYRTEIPFMLGDTFPSEEEQFEIYRQVCEAYRDKPVHMRILDIGGDKPLPYFPLVEENPALGWRGIRFCLDNASLLMTQVRAMLRAGAGTGNLRVLLPMVSSTGELQRFHALLDDALAQLAAEDIVVNRPEVGIMVEVPAAISQLAQWRGYIDFVSIGSNDLGQYLVAADRNNPRVSEVCDRLHPAVLREIERIIVTARELNLPASLCGEMSSDPAAVVLLLGMGLRCMSLSAARLPMIKWLVRAARADDAAALWASAKTLPDAAGIRHTTAEYLAGLNLAGLPFET